MTLSDFLKLLHSYIGMDWDNQDYLANLLLFVMPEPSTPEDEELDSRGEYYPYNGADNEKDMLGRIYNGKPLPKKKARMIKSHYVPKVLKEEIAGLKKETKTKMRSDFAGYGIMCSEGEEADICDEILELLLDAAVIGEQEIDVKMIGQKMEAVIPSYNDDELKREFGVHLLAETNQHCPMTGCLTPLYIEEDGRSAFDYKVVQINPKLPQKVIDNLIAMCPSCASRFMFSRSKEKVADIEDIKLNISSVLAAIDILPNDKLVAGVKRVVSKIGAIPLEQIVALNYNPTEVIKKMDKRDAGLFIKIHQYVSKYYLEVENYCKEMELEGTLNYEKFCSQIKFKYQDLRDMGLTQTQIFDVLTEWIARETNEDKSSCEVVVAYFVQKCDVYELQKGDDVS